MFKRQRYLDELIQFKDTEFIKIITGVHRCGKSCLLMLYKNYLLENGVDAKNIIYLNFEDYNTIDIQDEKTLFLYLKENSVKDQKMYFLFDEIQYVNGWQKVISSSFDSDITIIVSNKEVLLGPLATYLSGRCIEIQMFPLSFKEFVHIKLGNHFDKRELASYFEEYMFYGGFPAVVLSDISMKEKILLGIFETVFLNNIYVFNKIENFNLEFLIYLISNNIGKLMSVINIVDDFKLFSKAKISVSTMLIYLKFMENFFLFYNSYYHIRGNNLMKNGSLNKSRYYIVDNGIKRIILNKKNDNYVLEFENTIYIELLYRGYSVSVDNNHINKIFFAKKDYENLHIQVIFNLSQNFHKISNFSDDYYKKMIIVNESVNQTEFEGIPIVNVIDWLME
ncbi:MAG: ATP-binding protein [Lactobacillales bacterium]|jgi:predicted AAA+ superfamily ATPase|nr:ATP-binding protein [Lactobacillales bacterium]